jgi:hypothetical protein
VNPSASNLRYAQNRANGLHESLGSWDAVAEALRPFLALSGASWWYIAQGQRITRKHIDAFRAWDGLPPLPAEYLIEACPTCLGMHNLEQIPDCQGREVAAVVTLTADERVAQKRAASTPRTLSDYPTPLLKRLIEERQPFQELP